MLIEKVGGIMLKKILYSGFVSAIILTFIEIYYDLPKSLYLWINVMYLFVVIENHRVRQFLDLYNLKKRIFDEKKKSKN